MKKLTLTAALLMAAVYCMAGSIKVETAFPRPPSDGNEYVWKDGEWIISSGGSGSVTSTPPAELWADSLPAMRGDQVSVTTFTNATASTTHDMGYFEASKRQTFSAWHTKLPANSDSNVVISYPYFSTTTNKTFSPFVEYKIEGGSWTSVTGTLTTIPECSINERAQYSEVYNLPNAVAGEYVFIAAGIADTNTAGNYTADINVEVMTLDKNAQ